MSSPSFPWLTSLECSIASIQSLDKNDSSNFVLNFMHWLRFIFLSPCPQRILISCIDFVFLIIIFVFATKKLFSRFYLRNKANTTSNSINEPLVEIENSNSKFRITWWYYVTFIAASVLAAVYTVLSILAFTQGIQSPWTIVESVFRLAQTIASVLNVVLIAYEMKFKAVSHPLTLRLYWTVNLVTATLFAALGIARLISVSYGGSLDLNIQIDDIFSLAVNLPLSAFLFIVATRGISGISLIEEPEFDTNVRADADANWSGYATANWYSKAVWLWMNPLLSKGYKSHLTTDDVPSLPPKYHAQKMAELFEKNWPDPCENSKNPVRTTLIRCFWKTVVFTGFLSLLKLCVMYVGPLLIQSFVDYTSGKRSSPYQGYYLLIMLLLSKLVEVLSSHHFNFESRKLGMLIRSGLITTLYKKGVNLSCSSRQSHGVGQIVNYMAVDCQRLADMMVNLHPIWLMPLQAGFAVALLYGYLGVSVVSAIIMLAVVMVFTMWITQKNNTFMFSVMRYQDLRMKAINEMLSNMRVIKFQAWEDHFHERIQSFRELEYGWLTKFTYSISWNSVVLSAITSVMAALVFSVAIWLGRNLDAGTVFTAMTLIRLLQDPLRNFPQSLVAVSQAVISLKRLDGYLTSHELDDGAVDRVETCGENGIAVEVKSGTFSWDDDGGEAVLEDVNIEIKKGQLAAIVGTVGSGKSSLLASILGELQKVSGEVKVCGTTAYVAQTSWIRNATIEENILFGSPMNKERYREAIRVCSLEKDLEIMDHGDQTEIGERGINLSGGQKQRIQLARAVYQDCDIYLLDDVFSAVDAHTGSEIFKECVRGALKDKTILLVTHQVDFLHNADLILVMREGKIVQSGRYEELLKLGMDFGALVAAYETSMELVDMSTTTPNDNPTKTPKSPHSISGAAIQHEPNGVDRTVDQSSKTTEKGMGSNKLIKDEERETGRVNLQVYKQYSTEAYGWFGVVLVVIISIMSQSSGMASDYWLAYETSGNTISKPAFFIDVYWIIAVVSSLLILLRTFLVSVMGLKTAQRFFNQILQSILHAPMSFFDTTPTGRILTRASNDQANVDFLIPMLLSSTITLYFGVLGILFVTCQTAWPTIFLIIPLVWLDYWYRGYYLATSRELTRLDSITKAPIIHHFSETISGIMTVRSFRKQESFIQENIKRIDANLRMDLYNNGSTEWLGFRLELTGTIVLCTATMFLILLPTSFVSSANVGLYLSYGLSLNVMLFWTIYMDCMVENRLVSVERIKQFISISAEAAWRIPKSLPSPDWPSHGDIEIQNLQVKYRPNTPMVLKGISLKIHGGEKIGVVGRTGSGKSTLIQVFFRLVEPYSGKIVIDGVDICKLGLHDLRSRFSIIPQDPVLFQGTVRSNVDPLKLYSDEEIWKTLERCQLKDVVAAKPEKLSAPVVDSGDNWSVGQRQLLCLGRVLLKHSRVLFMDEATASVDSQTDAVIQKIIREDFSDCSIITIAHRIPTVIDCDRVLVIDDGWAKEYDKPTNLLERPSLFGTLVQEYAARSSDL